MLIIKCNDIKLILVHKTGGFLVAVLIQTESWKTRSLLICRGFQRNTEKFEITKFTFYYRRDNKITAEEIIRFAWTDCGVQTSRHAARSNGTGLREEISMPEWGVSTALCGKPLYYWYTEQSYNNQVTNAKHISSMQHEAALFILKNTIRRSMTKLVQVFVCFWRNSPQWARDSSFLKFLYHTQRRTTVGRTPLDEWSASRRDL